MCETTDKLSVKDWEFPVVGETLREEHDRNERNYWRLEDTRLYSDNSELPF